jgi:hypothetical protein
MGQGLTRPRRRRRKKQKTTTCALFTGERGRRGPDRGQIRPGAIGAHSSSRYTSRVMGIIITTGRGGAAHRLGPTSDADIRRTSVVDSLLSFIRQER